MQRLLALPLLVVLIAPAFAPAAVGTAVACAAGEGPHAALVIDTGARELELCVALPDESVSGLELVKLAAQQHSLDYALGFGGQAVCRLAGVGPSGGDCFADYPDFWGFWRGGPGGWTWSSSGAGSVSVTDGGMQGWSWGSGDSGTTHPAPPSVAIDDVCEPAPEPDPTPSPGGGGQGADGGEAEHTPSGSAAPPQSPAPGTSSASPSPRQSSETPTTDATREPTPDDDTSLLAAGGDAGGGGPPIGSFAAIGTAIALALGGAALARRRRNAEA